MPPKRDLKQVDSEPEDVEDAIEVREDTEKQRKISEELNEKQIGIFTVRLENVKMEWEGEIKNRPVDKAGLDKLVTSIQNKGLNRMAQEHHMIGSLPAVHVDSFLQAVGLTKEQIAGQNKKGVYPDVPTDWLDVENIKICLEAGQHRFAAVVEIHPMSPDQHWWIMRIFQSPLSMATLTYIRANDQFYMTPQTDGDRFLSYRFRWNTP